MRVGDIVSYAGFADHLVGRRLVLIGHEADDHGILSVVSDESGRSHAVDTDCLRLSHSDHYDGDES